MVFSSILFINDIYICNDFSLIESSLLDVKDFLCSHMVKADVTTIVIIGEKDNIKSFIDTHISVIQLKSTIIILPLYNTFGVISMNEQTENIREPANRKNVPPFKTAYKILFILDSISIAAHIVCVVFGICIEQRKLLGILFPLLVLLWIFLYNKAFGGIGNIIRSILGRDFYPF